MATSSSDRRAAVDKIRRDAQRADQRQGRIIILLSVLAALVIIGIPAVPIIKGMLDTNSVAKLNLSAIGAKASVCGSRILSPGTGTQQHVDPGTPVDYSAEASPPAFGQHEVYPDPIKRKMYTEIDRPRVAQLVHNLEHGYTIVWYDSTIADDSAAMTDLKGIADKFQGEDDFRKKLKIVPWLKTDGKPFPKGQHVAITHWAKEAAKADAAAAKKAKVTADAGVWQYCSEVSGQALQEFMTAYPYLNSPEPTAG
ncbi:hypothetical protein GCM10011584_02860 [Nocardioides phosphati]|uniref:DUF3105 domain-containing protein n=1 Tax=Nocardioides phosphati TaxID=1867775 RepID=A0ABQ2N6L3_9ACTN|nr:DUF3105 domain-containing protein [Nocardioides phosphati]GGO84685.1 hypothetical protein GCM10011584_02860 [Nocardioides phosphati]